MLIVSVILIVSLLVSSLSIARVLDKSEMMIFRKDLGIGAFYLAVDLSQNKYLLERTSPFKKETSIGKYQEDSFTYILDKEIVLANSKEKIRMIVKRELTRIK